MPRQGGPASSTRVEPGRSLNPTGLVPAASREDLGLPRRTGPGTAAGLRLARLCGKGRVCVLWPAWGQALGSHGARAPRSGFW